MRGKVEKLYQAKKVEMFKEFKKNQKNQPRWGKSAHNNAKTMV